MQNKFKTKKKKKIKKMMLEIKNVFKQKINVHCYHNRTF